MGIQTRKVKMVLNFLENKPEVFKLQQVNAPAVSYKQLIEECSVSCGVNTSQTKAVVDALTNRLVHYMDIGHPVKMGEFGSFKPIIRSKTTKRIDDLDERTIKRRAIRFYPGRDFRNMLAQMNVVSASENLNDPLLNGGRPAVPTA